MNLYSVGGKRQDEPVSSITGVSPVAHPVRKRYWSAVIADFRRSGLTQVEFCRRRHISVHSFRSWLYNLRHGLPTADLSDTPSPTPVPATASSSPASFLPVHVRSARSASSVATFDHVVSKSPPALELVLSGEHFVRIPLGFDPATLHQLLDVLEDRP
jgi:hypothetical protein